MANLQFSYAGPSRVPIAVTDELPPRKWKVFQCKLDAIQDIDVTPDFLWVDFGKAPKLHHAVTVIKHLANLQKGAHKNAFFFISGHDLPRATHRALLQRIYTTLPFPTDVVTDLIGQPDFSAAVSKFMAQREARLRPELVANPSRAAVQIPNADLRSERGRLSIKPIAELFGMDIIEIGRLIGRDNKAALSKTPDADTLQELLQPFADTALIRAPDFGDEQFRKWLNSPNEHMENRTPIAWIREGRAREVAAFVFGIVTGQPT